MDSCNVCDGLRQILCAPTQAATQPNISDLHRRLRRLGDWALDTTGTHTAKHPAFACNLLGLGRRSFMFLLPILVLTAFAIFWLVSSGHQDRDRGLDLD